MTVYTKTWNAKHKAVATAKTNLSKVTTAEAKQTQAKKNYDAQIASAQNVIDNITKEQNYYYKVNKKTKKKVLTKRKKPKKLTKTEQKKLDDAKTQLSTAKSKRTALMNTKAYQKADKNRTKAKDNVKSAQTALQKYEQKRHKTALKRVAAQTQQNYARFLSPHALLHATNSMTGLTVFLFATNESETNTSTVTTYPIDADDPVSDHVRRESKTIQITGYLYGQQAAKRLWAGKQDDVSGYGLPKKSVQQQYKDLLKWQFDGVELVYKSNWADEVKGMKANHIYYKHCVMSDLTKTLEKPLNDSVQITFNLTFIYKAKAKTSATPAKNNKGRKTTAGSYVGAKYVSVKYGMTYWGLAKKYGTTVAQLRKWNGSEKTTMYPDKSGKYPKKLRVTAGTGIKKATDVKTGQTVYTNPKNTKNLSYSIVDKIHRQLLSGEAVMNTDKVK